MPPCMEQPQGAADAKQREKRSVTPPGIFFRMVSRQIIKRGGGQAEFKMRAVSPGLIHEKSRQRDQRQAYKQPRPAADPKAAQGKEEKCNASDTGDKIDALKGNGIAV